VGKYLLITNQSMLRRSMIAKQSLSGNQAVADHLPTLRALTECLASGRRLLHEGWQIIDQLYKDKQYPRKFLENNNILLFFLLGNLQLVKNC